MPDSYPCHCDGSPVLRRSCPTHGVGAAARAARARESRNVFGECGVGKSATIPLGRPPSPHVAERREGEYEEDDLHRAGGRCTDRSCSTCFPAPRGWDEANTSVPELERIQTKIHTLLRESEECGSVDTGEAIELLREVTNLPEAIPADNSEGYCAPCASILFATDPDGEIVRRSDETLRIAKATRMDHPTVGPNGEEPDYEGMFNDARGGDQ